VSAAARTQFLLVLAALVGSGLAPYDRLVWAMEASPVILGMGLMALRWRRFPWTPLALALATLFALILCLGAHSTYTRAPLGEWLRTALELQRNPYDRIAHCAQGMTTGLLARELLLRCTGLRPGRALYWVSVSIAVAIAAAHELVEWRAALIAAPEAGLAYLGGQGDVWDAQADLALALCGALVALRLFGRVHERQLSALHPGPGPWHRGRPA
jgi:putative membrane protein